MRIRILTAVIISSFALVGCGSNLGGSFNPAEKQGDFEPGFFSPDEELTKADREGGEGDTKVLSPEEEAEYIETLQEDSAALKALLSFPQTEWNECTDNTSGNYLDFACAKKRNVSQILDGYLQGKLISCVNTAMTAQGGGEAGKVHLVHAGVTADARHSPKSLHSYNRAIDIKAIRINLKAGGSREYTYSKIGNRPFYAALRNCWGKLINTTNGCPLYRGSTLLTGSIGWENSDHGKHMHLSVPYCVNGKYGPGLWVR